MDGEANGGQPATEGRGQRAVHATRRLVGCHVHVHGLTIADFSLLSRGFLREMRLQPPLAISALADAAEDGVTGLHPEDVHAGEARLFQPTELIEQP